MAEYTIDKIEYGDNVYKLQDNVSGYVSGGNVVPYLTCGTGASTVAKTTTLVTGTLPATLTTGTRVAVRFEYSNTASNPTITIGSYGAIAIKRYGTTAPSTSAATSWNAGNVITLVYDGTYWLMADWTSPNTTYSEISEANITNGSGSTTGLVTGRRAKAAVEAFQTDEKVGISLVESDTMYYPIVGTDTATASREYDSDFTYMGTAGTTNTIGIASISLGNYSGSTTEGNKRGMIRLYGSGSGHTRIYTNAANGADVYFPNKGGTIALTDDITDEKLAVSQITERTLTYYPILGASIAGVNINTASTRQYDKGLSYSSNSAGTTAYFTVGDYSLNDLSAHKTGTLNIVGADGGHQIVSGADNGGIYNITLPKQQGTIALTSDIPADEKVSTTVDAVNDTVYYPIFGTDSTTASTKKIDTSGFKYSTYNGTASVLGTSILYIGNSISQGYVNNKRGSIYLYSASGYKHTIYGGTNGCSNDRTITLPDKTGTVALTSDIVDEKIKLTFQSTSGTYPLIFGPASITTNSTYQGYYNTGITVNPSTKTITATTFVGDLTGTASGNLTSSSTLDATKLSGTIPSSCYTNTTYGISGSLSNHAFTSTLTAGGSGTTSVLTLAEGTGITLTDDTTNKKITIACSVTNTDTKVSTAAITSEASYYPVLGSDTTAAETKFYDNTGFGYTSRIGTASTEGTAVIALGNNISTGTAGNKSGRLLLYGKNSYTASILTADLTAHTTIKFPNKSGTIALTSDITDTKVSTAAVTSGTTYYPTLGSDTTSAATKFYDKTGIKYSAVSGAPYDYSTGDAMLTLGNDTGIASNGYKRGVLRLYSRYENYTNLVTDITGYNNEVRLPESSGTLALQSELPSISYIRVTEDTDLPGTYNSADLSNFSSQANMNYLFLELIDTSNTDLYDSYILTDYYVEPIVANDYNYEIWWFTGAFKKTGDNQKKITVGIYLDELEIEHEYGEVTVNIDERAFFYVNSLTSVTISSTSTPIKLPITGMSSGVGFTYDSTNKGIVCHKTSRYAISAQIGLDTATSGDLIGLHIYKDGTSIVGPSYHRVGGNYDCALLLPTIITMEKDSVYTVYIRNNTNSRGKTSTGVRISCWEVQ